MNLSKANKSFFKYKLYKFLCYMILLSGSLTLTAQEINTYKGRFPLLSYDNIYTSHPEATYSYYEGEDYSRVFHGPISVRYHGDGSTKKYIRWGKIEGQFKDGFYDGEWTISNPVVFSENKARFYYTTKLKCSFKDGVLDGPMVISMTDRANKVLIQAELNFKEGELDGEISYINKLPSSIISKYEIKQLNGQYKNGYKVGRWNYLNVRGEKGLADFDKKENFIIDSETGIREKGEDLSLSNLKFGMSVQKYINALEEITNNPEKSFSKVLADRYKEQNSKNNGIAKEEEIFAAVEQPAEFPGGQVALMKWINENLQYPQTAKSANINGRVIVKIVVEKDGSLSQAQIVRSVNNDLDNEALRLINTMPKWQPGKNNGKPVRSYFNIPISFKNS